MTILLDQRDDGSLALFIDGDLQFDSRDERSYHEALALPALALAVRRSPGPLRALICGGGDGLCARELLKSPRLAALDLVDFDPTIVALAQRELHALNDESLADPRVTVHVADAEAFASEALRSGTRYDVIVSDLTVPQDLAGARLHSVEWYELLAGLLADGGILAANAASPSGSADAYWSIFNSVRAAGLYPRPYRIALPSFAAQGYGGDWGFVVASGRPIEAGELDDGLPLAEPRCALHSAAQLRRCFAFPGESAARRATALPTRAGSSLLLHYLDNSPAIADAPAADWTSLGFVVDPVPCPAADAGDHLLPLELRGELRTPAGSVDEQVLLQRVLDLIPALDRAQTRTMIGTFLEEPARFLAAVDLPGLVDRLLQRAAELPRQLRAELRLLAARLKGFADNPTALLRLGMRIVTIITLVVVIAHLAVPDAVYGKGGTGAGGEATSSLAHAGADTGGYTADAPTLARGGGYRSGGIGSSQSVDETGTLYPPRSYRYHPRGYYRSYSRSYSSYRYGSRPAAPAAQGNGIYRLTPEADILPDGQVVIGLTDAAYLLIGDDVASVVDRQSGEPLVFLGRDPALLRRVATEIRRQQVGLQQSADAKRAWMAWIDWLQFTPWYEDDRREFLNLGEMRDRLEEALRGLGNVPETQPPLPQPAVPGALEIFSSVWMLQDGSAVAARLPGNELAFFDGTGWYTDRERKQPHEGTYPKGFLPVVVAYLTKELSDMSATRSRVAQDMSAAQMDLTSLQRDAAEYEGLRRSGTRDGDSVDYGTSQMPLSEALQRTYADLATTQQRIAALRGQQDALPATETTARKLLGTLKEHGVQ